MGMAILVLTLALAAPAADDKVETAADQVTLRDGSVLLGQVVDPSPRGALAVLVRRAWAVEHLPEWSDRWQTAELASLRRARTQRRSRLESWRKERTAAAERDDPILAWIDRELPELADPTGPADSTLMALKLSRGDVRSVMRRPRAAARMLRQGWLSGFANAETLPLEELGAALEGRGFAPNAHTPVSIDKLLPIPLETDVQWSNRRAATEVTNDAGLKFIRTGPLVLPEPVPGQPLEANSAASALGGLKRLLGDQPGDPLAEALQQVAVRGRTGAVVTQLEISPDLSAVRVQSTLWVRRSGRWIPAGMRQSVVRPNEVAPRAAEPLAQDPQIQGIFEVVESLGLGQIPDAVKKQSLTMGAATQQALGQVRSALIDDLTELALPIREADAKPPAEKP